MREWQLREVVRLDELIGAEFIAETLSRQLAAKGSDRTEVA
jgi:hypothetical protein